MPVIIDDLSPAGGRARYPWADWFDGKARRFEQGVDFDCTARGFRSCALQAASRRRVRLSTRLYDDAVELQAIGTRD